MPERSPKRKGKRDSPTSSIGEPETSSLRTADLPSISGGKDFTEISQKVEKVEKSVGKRIKKTENNERDLLKMIENLSSKIDSLAERV